MQNDDLDYDLLDPGIREVVRLLRSWGFKTTDSGDGKTKVGKMECALSFPHVIIPIVGSGYFSTRWLMRRLKSIGVEVHPVNEEGLPCIEMSYDPVNNLSILMLKDLDDEALEKIVSRS